MRLPILLLLVLPIALRAQPLMPVVVTPLAKPLAETSDLVRIGSDWWTLLDSGNPHAIYRIDPATGAVLHAVSVINAANVDWEAMTTDAQWLYIGDVGNNSGARTDLRVYRVSLADLEDPDAISVLADTVRFSYALQTDFTPANNSTDWDCEAMVARDDSLFLFSKNWVSGNCYLYALPATPGDQVAERRDTLASQGMITGASVDPATGDIALVGYTNSFYMPFIWRLSGYPGHAFFQGDAQRNDLAIGITQMEGVAWNGTDELYMTNEQNILNTAQLWSLDLGKPSGINGPIHAKTAFPPLTVCPNPTIDHIRLSGLSGVGDWELFDLQGRALMKGSTNTVAQAIDLSAVAPGGYLLQVTDALGARTVRVMKE
jgi:hypothetical protein